ncbi:Peptidase A1 domain-containing protein [Aphelenchoides bicaudatus]|nr:Peptidase A1 domain-containing protein [Aphelenchoides bicaudatus]
MDDKLHLLQSNYMGGQSTGIIAKESLTALAIPGRDPPSIPLPVVDEPKGDLVNGPATGVMGMGFLPENSKQPGTFLQGLMKNLDLPVFEIYLQSYTYSKAKDVSTYGNVTYGNKDTDHCEEQHVIAAIGSSPLNAGTAMFYPGSPRIHAPTAVVRAIRNRIHARLDTSTNEYYVDCRCLKRLPRLYLTIGGQKLVFYPREYVAKLDNTNKCMLMIQTASNRYKGADWILGDPALRENCVFYDFAVPQVGLARHNTLLNFR